MSEVQARASRHRDIPGCDRAVVEPRNRPTAARSYRQLAILVSDTGDLATKITQVPSVQRDKAEMPCDHVTLNHEPDPYGRSRESRIFFRGYYG